MLQLISKRNGLLSKTLFFIPGKANRAARNLASRLIKFCFGEAGTGTTFVFQIELGSINIMFWHVQYQFNGYLGIFHGKIRIRMLAH